MQRTSTGHSDVALVGAMLQDEEEADSGFQRPIAVITIERRAMESEVESKESEAGEAEAGGDEEVDGGEQDDDDNEVSLQHNYPFFSLVTD